MMQYGVKDLFIISPVNSRLTVCAIKTCDFGVFLKILSMESRGVMQDGNFFQSRLDGRAPKVQGIEGEFFSSGDTILYSSGDTILITVLVNGKQVVFSSVSLGLCPLNNDREPPYII